MKLRRRRSERPLGWGRNRNLTDLARAARDGDAFLPSVLPMAERMALWNTYGRWRKPEV